MTLTSLSDHSDNLSASTYSDSEKWKLHRKRVGFGKQPLELWMFVPCDEDGNVLKEPIYYQMFIKQQRELFSQEDYNICKEYQEAKERCLFDGFHVIGQDENYFELEMIDKDFWITFVNEKCQIQDEDFDIENIEHLLLNSIEDLQLTPTAIKQLGYE